MKIEDRMSPCFRRCGAFVPTEGPAICRSCTRGGPSAGWQRRLLLKWIEEKARDWRRTASRFEERARRTDVDPGYARAAEIYISRLRAAADTLSIPVTDAEWQTGIARPSVVVDDPYGHEDEA